MSHSIHGTKEGIFTVYICLPSKINHEYVGEIYRTRPMDPSWDHVEAGGRATRWSLALLFALGSPPVGVLPWEVAKEKSI